MIALDTNVFVRLRFASDMAMTARARALVAERGAYVARTVVLESFWLLTSRLGRTRDEVLAFLREALDTPAFVFEEAESIRQALSAMEAGLDPADALHLCATPHGTSFATFDSKLQARAKRAGIEIPVMIPAA